MSLKIGITEQGDPAFDFNWIDKLRNNVVDGAIIISKGVNSQLEQGLLEFKDKIIYHNTCTGLGGTCLEPNVPPYKEKLDHVKRLMDNGFSASHIVMRIDPIVGEDIIKFSCEPYINNYDKFLEVLCEIIEFAVKNGIRRIRYSFCDYYKHVRERFHNQKIIDFSSSNTLYYDEQQRYLTLFKDIQSIYPFISFESCGEKYTPINHKLGCVSIKDIKILGLDVNQCHERFNIRNECLCCSPKIELLSNKSQCPHGCLYCYWK